MSRRVVAAALAMCAAAFLPVAPGAQAPRKASWLTDGGDPQRTSWQQNETHPHQRQRQGHEAAVDGADSTTSRGRCTTCFRRSSSATSTTPQGPQGDRGRRRRLRQHLRHRRREGDAALEAALRQHVPGAGRRAAAAGRSVPAGSPRRRVIAPTDAPGKYIVVRDLLGRPAAASSTSPPARRSSPPSCSCRPTASRTR